MMRSAFTVLTKPTDGASLGMFRMLCGCMAFFQALDLLLSGKLAREYAVPRIHFSYPLTAGLAPPGSAALYAIGIAMLIAAFSLAVGYKARASAGIFTLLFAYLFLLERTQYLNHYYLLILLTGILACSQCNRFLAVDQFLHPQSTIIPAWNVLLLRFQIAVVHIFAAVAKLNFDWISGAPVRLWLGNPEEWVVQTFVWGGILINALVIPGLLWRRTRVAAFTFALAFHLMNAFTDNLGIFPWLMIAVTTLFVDPSWPRQITQEPIFAKTDSYPFPWFARWGLLLYVTVQTLVPLRHFWIPGNVHWTEEGRTFAWHMKGRDKQSSADVFLHTPKGIFPVDSRMYMSPFQKERMEDNPALLRQFARKLALEYEQLHGERIAVHAEAWSSLNGKAPQLLLPPSENIAAE